MNQSYQALSFIFEACGVHIPFPYYFFPSSMPYVCAVDTKQINFFLCVIKQLLYPFPCSISAEKSKWEYAA